MPRRALRAGAERTVRPRAVRARARTWASLQRTREQVPDNVPPTPREPTEPDRRPPPAPRPGRHVGSAERRRELVLPGPFPTAPAFTTWTYALSRTTAGRTGTTTYAVPADVILIAWIALTAVPAPLTLLGGAICLAGVAVSRRRRSAAER
ncbi:EamA family transporter [Streptomyces sp. ISL-44]|nr:EamA family transporter [Streptomyces sp. ISL-44]